MINPGPGYRWNPPPDWPAAPHGWVMPKEWEPDAAWPPAPEGWVFWEPVALSPTRKATALLGAQWSGLQRKTKVLTVIGSSIVALALLGTVVGSPPKTTASRSSVADSTPSPIASPEASPTDLPSPSSSAADPKTLPAVPVPSPVDQDTVKIADWISKTQHSTNEVQVAVQSVQTGVALIQNGTPTADDLASLSAIIKQAGGFLDEAQADLFNQIDSPLKSQRQEAWYAASQLSDAMGKLRNYLDTQKPSDLADYRDKFAAGQQYWNEAVNALWARAGKSKPPTV